MDESRIERPTEVRVNGWTGAAAPSQTLPERTPWGQKQNLAARTQWLAPAAPADPRDWQHPDVGWGLVLPDDDSLGAVAKAKADDAPLLRPLLDKRPGAPVLRWRPELQQSYLRRYYEDGSAQDLSAQAPSPGISRGRIPQYLLIVASPRKIPWAVQYALNMSTFVGRLDCADDKGLENDQGLKNYVSALVNDWQGQTTQPRAPVVWRVDHGEPDITWLMARSVAGKLWEKFEGDKDNDFTGRTLLKDGEATGDNLAAALAGKSPSLIVTTSHGMTGPLDNTALLKSQLGAPVDVQHRALSLAQLGAWKPSGAIWYAHACCSAGSDQQSRYKGLLPDDGAVGSMLNGVAAGAGAMVAPLAQALLGAEQPLRAFVGHVEPTFDWTLRDPINKQVLTSVLTDALYTQLYQQDKRTPIGFAMKEVYKQAGSFYGAWQTAVHDIDRNVPGMRDWALYRQLVAMDRQTLVILGDPTVAVPRFS
jgi:hypothetical protein